MNNNFYYDVVCPYAYMAFSFLKRQGVFEKEVLNLKPILLGGLFKLMDQESDPNEQMYPQKKQYIRDDILAQAKQFSLPLKFHSRHPVQSLKAMRLLQVCPKEILANVSETIFQAYWVDNADIDDEKFVDEVAIRFGLRRYKEYYDEAKEKLLLETKNAYEQKIFGVPSFKIDNEIFFGADRIVLFGEKIGLNLTRKKWRPSSKPIDFYFDFSSPYSFLAFKEMEKAKACGVKINFVPVLLGAIFKEIHQANIPIFHAHEHKRNYLFKDMNDWAKFRGHKFIFNTHFPLRSVFALRLSLVCPELTPLIFEAAWEKNIDISDPKVLIDWLSERTDIPQASIEETQTQNCKDRLKKNTDSAIKLGVFGVPSFLVEKQLIFGQDRFERIKT